MIRKLDRLEGQKLLHECKLIDYFDAQTRTWSSPRVDKFIVTASERGDLEEVRKTGNEFHN